MSKPQQKAGTKGLRKAYLRPSKGEKKQATKGKDSQKGIFPPGSVLPEPLYNKLCLLYSYQEHGYTKYRPLKLWKAGRTNFKFSAGLPNPCF